MMKKFSLSLSHSLSYTQVLDSYYWVFWKAWMIFQEFK